MAGPAEIVIIGAGPSGLMAAEVLATAGHHVAIYDRMPTPARKFLIAGRGGLNLTHSEPLEQFLTRYGDAAEWLAPSITAYPPEAVRAWCESLGQETFVGSSGRVFPRHMKATQLLRAWLNRLESLNVKYVPRLRWQGFQDGVLRFADPQWNTQLVEADAVLLALGGASWPKLGSDGSWTSILAAQNVAMEPLRPSNVGFTVSWSDYFTEKFAGEPLKSVAITHSGVTRQGEAMITRTGIEGGVIYALSGDMRDAIEREGEAHITLDLRPSMTLEALTEKFDSHARANKSFSTYLRKLNFSPLAIALLREAFGDQLPQLLPAQLSKAVKFLPITLTGTSGMVRAISSAGGITRAAVTDDFMLREIPGMFVAGEMLNWEAPTGGYLLQACFSTAVAAAQGMLRYCAQHGMAV